MISKGQIVVGPCPGDGRSGGPQCPPAFALFHVLVRNGGADVYLRHWFSLTLQSRSVEEEQVVDLRYGIGALPKTPRLPGRSSEFPV